MASGKYDRKENKRLRKKNFIFFDKKRKKY